MSIVWCRVPMPTGECLKKNAVASSSTIVYIRGPPRASFISPLRDIAFTRSSSTLLPLSWVSAASAPLVFRPATMSRTICRKGTDADMYCETGPSPASGQQTHMKRGALVVCMILRDSFGLILPLFARDVHSFIQMVLAPSPKRLTPASCAMEPASTLSASALPMVFLVGRTSLRLAALLLSNASSSRYIRFPMGAMAADAAHYSLCAPERRNMVTTGTISAPITGTRLKTVTSNNFTWRAKINRTRSIRCQAYERRLRTDLVFSSLIPFNKKSWFLK